MERHYILIICIATFIIYASLLFRIAKKFEHSSPYFAFIPVLNLVQFLEIGRKSSWWIAATLIPPLIIDTVLFFILSDYPYWALLVFFGVPLLGFLILVIQIARVGIYIAESSGHSKLNGFFMVVPYFGLYSLFIMGSGSVETAQESVKEEGDQEYKLDTDTLTKDDMETVESIINGLQLGVPKEEIKAVALGSGVECEKFERLYEEAEKKKTQ